MAQKILIVGRNGYLGRLMASRAPQLDYLAHSEITGPEVFNGYDIVINMALDPRYVSMDYEKAIDFELRVGEMLAPLDSHLVMISTRKVYTLDVAFGARETDAAHGVDSYGRNKCITEKALTDLLGNRLLILRLANVAGFEILRPQLTFFPQMLNSLKADNRIVFDISPSTRRDFITDDAVINGILEAAERKLGGIYNLGSGTATEVGNLAHWVIEGYGSGELCVQSDEVRDEFVLNVGKLESELGPLCDPDDLRRVCVDAGRKLKGE